jgi:NAD(P)-dependent dehydrogenase (short-subunit alcohol dehydrogenase family)
MKASRVAIVTGASRGLGQAIARRLAGLGLHVVGTSRQGTRLDGLDAQPLDVGDPQSVARLVGYVERELGRVDVLVNNAGVALDKFVPVMKMKPEVLDATLRTNLTGPVLCAQAFVPLMVRGGYGRIVNMSSQLGSLARMTGLTFAYRASKVALNALTRVLADELKDTNVLVNSVCPGWVRTELGGHDAPLSPEDAVDTAVWLATLPDDGPRGGFFQDRQPLPW